MAVEAILFDADATPFIDDTAANVAAAASVGLRAELFVAEAGTDAVQRMKGILARHGVALRKRDSL